MPCLPQTARAETPGHSDGEETISLELKGNIDVDVQKYESHADKSHDGKTANVTVGWDVTEEEAKKIGGSTFKMGVFAGYVGGSGVALHKSFKRKRQERMKCLAIPSRRPARRASWAVFPPRWVLLMRREMCVDAWHWTNSRGVGRVFL